MKENRQIVKMWRSGAASVLVTLVKAEGSSYRRPGARLMVGDQNDYTGTISGGCLEAEVQRKAAWLVRRGATVEQYSTVFDDTMEIPFGLGCGGVVDLLLEPANTSEFTALMSALDNSLSGEESTVLTWLPKNGSEFARAILTSKGDFVFASERLTEQALTHVRACVLYGLQPLPEEVFVERLTPPQRLFILGAGNDAKPLVSMAALLGWSVHVLDGRAQLAIPERFPDAELVGVADATALSRHEIKRDDAIVLMTHSYEQDREFLATVLPLRPKYLGLLGARHRTSLLITEVSRKLGWSIEECCEHVHAPIGLNLGGDGPEAIALAIIAEVQAACMGRLAESRGLSAQDVDNYVREGNNSRYTPTRCALDIS